ncbi:MAG: PrgI family mobile element protein [Deltaproteobacteria bacterium]
MKSYLIPRDVKGETRILTYFSPKSFLFTVIGIVIGTIFYFIFKLLTLKITGIVVLVLISLISFGIGALKIPETNAFAFFKDTGGESIDDIIWRYIRFHGIKPIGLRGSKKIYTYGRRDNE